MTLPPWSVWLEAGDLASLRESLEWFHRPPGGLSRFLGFLDRPMEKAWQKVPESARNSTAEAIHSGLKTVLETTSRSLATQSILDALCAEAGREVSGPDQIRRMALSGPDRVSRRSVEAHRRAAAVEGGVSGLAGLPGLLLDVPALYGLIFRMIQEVSIAFGFPIDPLPEKAHILKVMDLGHQTGLEARRLGLEELQAMHAMLGAGVAGREMEKQVLLRGLGALAEKLGTDLTRRKLAQTLAVIGSVVGAGVNYQLLGDVGDTARHAYRLRFLRRRARERENREGRPTRKLSLDS